MRPKSKTDDERREEVAFKHFPDYSKLNSDRHNASRSDTFATASMTQPPLKKRTTSCKVSGDDITSINSSYLISGLRHDVRELGREIKSDIQEEVQQTLESLHQQVQSTLDVVRDTRDSTVGVIMTRLKEDIHKILMDAGWSGQPDFAPIQEEIRDAKQAGVQRCKNLMDQFESRLGERIAPVITDVPALRGMHEQLTTDLESTHKRLVDDMFQLRQTVIGEIAQKMQMMQIQQETFFENNANLGANFESQLKSHVQEHPVNVDFKEVVDVIREGNAKIGTDFEQVRRHLRSLSEDIESIKGEVANATVRGIGESKKSEVMRYSQYGGLAVFSADRDTNWTQTDAVEKAHGSTQTEVPWKARAGAGNHRTSVKTLQTKDDRKMETKAESTTMKVHAKASAVFADGAAMKLKAREKLIKKPYNVFDKYSTTGWAQAIARSQTFENITFVMVVLNAIWIAVDADHNEAPVLINAHPVFQIVENLFCAYFTWELVTRLLAFEKKIDCLKDGWFVFDLSVLSLIVFETWIMTLVFLIIGSSTEFISTGVLRLVRVVKILRLSRLARLTRSVPEIMILLKGIGAAARSVASLFALWLIIIYVFAVFFVQAMKDGDVDQFEDVPTGMNTLLLHGVLPNSSGLIDLVSEEHFILWPVILGFVLLASITLSYMLIGVLVQIVHVIADAEKEKGIVEYIANGLRRHWERRLHDMEAVIRLGSFKRLLADVGVADFLQEVDVDIIAIDDLSELLYADIPEEQGGISFENFVNIVLNMRGTNPATVCDMKRNSRYMKNLFKEATDSLTDNMNLKFIKCSKQINSVRKVVLGESEDESEIDGGAGSDIDRDSQNPRESTAVVATGTTSSLLGA
jgi:hypothetical protein